MHELTEAQQHELRRYVVADGTGVVMCVVLSMLAENDYSGDVWAVVDRAEAYAAAWLVGRWRLVRWIIERVAGMTNESEERAA